jgi:hypothetical protein
MTPPKRLRRSPQGATPADRRSRIRGVRLDNPNLAPGLQPRAPRRIEA